MERYWPGEDRSKILILEDGCSAVAGYEKDAKKFFNEMKDKGLTITTCSDVFLLLNAAITTEQQKIDLDQNQKIKAQDERDIKQDNLLNNIMNLLAELKLTKN